jgi:SAM-dependent methyltransferase
MNFLGHLIQKYVSQDDTVLDLGCGIMQATTDLHNKSTTLLGHYWKKVKRVGLRLLRTKKPLGPITYVSSGSLKCKSLLGCDIWTEYLKVANKRFPVVKIGMDELDRFIDDSFDVIICLDVLEHLPLQSALDAIEHMKRIARKKVIIYTPAHFEEKEEQIENHWGLGQNPYQKHLCFLDPQKIRDLGFEVQFPKPENNTFGVFTKQKRANLDQ